MNTGLRARVLTLVGGFWLVVSPLRAGDDTLPRAPGRPDSPGFLAAVGEEVLPVDAVFREVAEKTEQKRFDRLTSWGEYQLELFVEVLWARERWIEERLLSQAARAAGVTVEALLQREAGEESGDGTAPRARLVARLRQAAGDAVRVPPYRLPIETAGYPSLGAATAPVVVVSFSDLYCGLCRDLEPALTSLLDRFPGEVRLVARHFPLSASDGESFRAVEAAHCAHDQGKYWEFREEFFAGGFDEGAFETTTFRFAARHGMDTVRFQSCLESRHHIERVRGEQEEGAGIGVFGTPMVFVNGRRVSDARDGALVEKLIRLELDRRTQASAK